MTHGNTLCTHCKFKAVIAALAETAFVVSDMPVFISLEMHCSPSQQIKIAQTMRQVCTHTYACMCIYMYIFAHT